MGHTKKYRTKGHSLKNGSNLVKWSHSEKWVALGKMGHIQNNGSHTQKTGSHLEKWVTLEKWLTLAKMGNRKIGYIQKNGSHLKDSIPLKKKWSEWGKLVSPTKLGHAQKKLSLTLKSGSGGNNETPAPRLTRCVEDVVAGKFTYIQSRSTKPETISSSDETPNDTASSLKTAGLSLTSGFLLCNITWIVGSTNANWNAKPYWSKLFMDMQLDWKSSCKLSFLDWVSSFITFKTSY